MLCFSIHSFSTVLSTVFPVSTDKMEVDPAMKQAMMQPPTAVMEIPVQEASEDIWDKKYRLKTKDGTILDQSVDDTYKRVARALAEVEAPGKRDECYERFLRALRHGRSEERRVGKEGK